MTLVEPKPSPRPWFALWRAERGTFAQLPLMARALFGEILKLTNDNGVIDIGTRSPADAIAWALGADRADRRALARYVPMLLTDGCLVHEGTRLIAPNFARWQPEQRAPRRAPANHEPTATAPRTDHEAAQTDRDRATNEPRSDHDGATTELRRSYETTANRAEPFTSTPESRVEESREREEDTHTSRARVAERAKEAARRAFIRAYAERYHAATGDAWMSHGAYATEVDRIAGWCAAVSGLQGAALVAEAEARARAVVEGTFADPWLGGIDDRSRRHRRWPLGPVAKDPAKYAALTAPAAVEAPKSELEELEARFAELKRQAEHARFSVEFERARELERQLEVLRPKLRAARGKSGKAA